jgi:hypothetical protein
MKKGIAAIMVAAIFITAAAAQEKPQSFLGF